MVAAVEPTILTNVHERVRLALNLDRLHFFDGRDGTAI
jgi:multiple sugar transport system ATP-binding protein